MTSIYSQLIEGYTMIKVYITDLSAYAEGTLVGKWISLPLSSFELAQALSEVLCEGEFLCKSEGHEEVFITDYEAVISIGEYDDISRLNKLAEALEPFDEEELLKLKFLASEGYNEREVIDNGLDTYEVNIYDYRGKRSLTDTFELLASDFVDEGLFGEIPESVINYIDYEKIARDLRMDYSEFEDGVIGRVA